MRRISMESGSHRHSSHSARSSGFGWARRPSGRSARSSMSSSQTAGMHRPPVATLTSVFQLDPATIKQKVRANLQKPRYSVADSYWETGWCQYIATSAAFERITLIIIAINAVWVAVDTDWNDQAVLMKADFIFQFAEHFFCAFFFIEWVVRFGAFKRKRDCIRDSWFIFDTILVSLMVIETWIFQFALALLLEDTTGESDGLGDTSILRLARVLRLARMARMARLLRALPELMILVKGLMVAMRSVLYALFLLMSIVFVFAIAFTQLSDGYPFHHTHFDHVTLSVYTLLFRGALMDNAYYLINDIGDSSLPLAGLFAVFALMSALTLMNMLVGVLVEVVSSVANMEYETSTMTWVRSKMEPLMEEIDRDGNKLISRDEFMKLIQNVEVIETLQEVGVDPIGLVDYADFIFCDDVTGEELGELSYNQFIEVVLELRGSNAATVKDIVDLRKFITQVFYHFETKLDSSFAKRMADSVDSAMLMSHVMSSSFRPSSDPSRPSSAGSAMFHDHPFLSSGSRQRATVIMQGRSTVPSSDVHAHSGDQADARRANASRHSRHPSESRRSSKGKSGSADKQKDEMLGPILTPTPTTHYTPIRCSTESTQVTGVCRESMRSAASSADGMPTIVESSRRESDRSDVRSDVQTDVSRTPLTDASSDASNGITELIRKELENSPLFVNMSAETLADDLTRSLEHHTQNLRSLQALPVDADVPGKSLQGASRGLQPHQIRLHPHGRLHEGHLGDVTETSAESESPRRQDSPGAHTSILKASDLIGGDAASVQSSSNE